MSFVLQYMKKYTWLFCSAVLCLCAEAFCDLMQPALMSGMIDTGVKQADMDYVLRSGGLMLSITFLGAIFALLRNNLAGRVSQSFGRDLRNDTYKKILSLPAQNTDQFETASLITRLTNDITQLQNFINGSMRIFVKAPMMCIGGMVMAIILNVNMSVILAIILPIVAVLIIINIRIGFPWFVKVQSAVDKMGSVMREYLSGVRVVRAFNRFDYEEARFEAATGLLAKTATHTARVTSVFGPAITLTINVGIVAVLYMGSLFVGGGNMEIGKISAFIVYMTQILHALMLISNIFAMFTRAGASSDRIGEVLCQKSHMTDNIPPISPAPAADAICFSKVCFSYPGSVADVLSDISFTCKQGSVTGMIGSTGSGKSSLISLIPRFYDATGGSVCVFGVDVRKMDIQTLREIVGIVPQKSLLFSGTIAENLRWGNSSATLEEMEMATKIACIDDFISSLPKGFETVLGQGGINLSGGQKQRLCIARALMRSPKILIMDDSTSAVDISTEQSIRNALGHLKSSPTQLIVAQRMSSVMHADQIIVLDEGGIAGIGSHRQLMHSCDIYRDIYRSQIGKDDPISG